MSDEKCSLCGRTIKRGPQPVPQIPNASLDLCGQCEIEKRAAGRAMTTTSQTLRAAAVYLKEHGWVQGRITDYFVGTGMACCAFGAITRTVEAKRSVALDATAALADYLVRNCDATEYPEQPSRTVAHWNDSTNQTAENVIATLLAAGDELDGNG